MATDGLEGFVQNTDQAGAIFYAIKVIQADIYLPDARDLISYDIDGFADGLLQANKVGAFAQLGQFFGQLALGTLDPAQMTDKSMPQFPGTEVIHRITRMICHVIPLLLLRFH